MAAPRLDNASGGVDYAVSLLQQLAIGSKRSTPNGTVSERATRSVRHGNTYFFSILKPKKLVTPIGALPMCAFNLKLVEHVIMNPDIDSDHRHRRCRQVLRLRGPVDARLASAYSLRTAREPAIECRASRKGFHVPSVYHRALSVLLSGQQRAGVFHGLATESNFPLSSKPTAPASAMGFSLLDPKVESAAPLAHRIRIATSLHARDFPTTNRFR